jgi:hypothetical protein
MVCKGSASPVQLATRIRAPDGEQRHRAQGGHQQPWWSERPAQRGEHRGTRALGPRIPGRRARHARRGGARGADAPRLIAAEPRALLAR